MKKALRIPDYLEHIAEAIERIEEYTADVDQLRFMNTCLIQDAVVRNIEVIGEAAKNIQNVDPSFAAAVAACLGVGAGRPALHRGGPTSAHCRDQHPAVLSALERGAATTGGSPAFCAVRAGLAGPGLAVGR